MNRRDFIHLAGAGAIIGAMPELALAAQNRPYRGRILVLIELKGGNDGFNTLIPYDDDQYYRLRNKIGIRRPKLIPLKDGMGMHLSLKPLKSLWDAGDMAWIQGVGYPNGILSHFRSMDVWNSGIPQSNSANGWLSLVLPRFKQGLHGISVTRDQNALGPLSGAYMNSVSMENPKSFMAQNRLIKSVTVNKSTAALAHITSTQHQLSKVGHQIASKMQHPQNVPMHRPKGILGHSLKSVAELIMHGVDAPVYKVTQSGFDTHVGQLGQHANVLYHVGYNLAAFTEAMKRAGVWDRMLIVTYSEFGRRIKENKGQGTDHGTASVNLVMGGNIRPGIHGQHPNLRNLDANDNVAHTTDFRSIYATLAQRWWGQPNVWRAHRPIGFV